jgi:Domain of unknown function (DUF5615)
MPQAYLLDENLRGPLATGLWHHNLLGVDPVDFVCVGDLSGLPLGASDLEILAWSQQENRILVSNDRATLATHLSNHLKAGGHSPGIFLVERSVLIKSIVDALVLYAYASEPAEWYDRIEYVS